MFPPDLTKRAEEFLVLCREHQLMVSTAESCTGGLLIGLLTEIAGSSAVVERGFITYSNDAKRDQLGVSADLLEAFGAVSEEVAGAMAQGALSRSPAHIAVAITGIAGPGGGSPEKPVGLVHFACARRGYPTRCERRLFANLDRSGVRLAAVRTALEMAALQAAEVRCDVDGGP